MVWYVWGGVVWWGGVKCEPVTGEFEGAEPPHTIQGFWGVKPPRMQGVWGAKPPSR